ncbi:MAG: cell division protein FtsA [Campylobacterota bacterium]|nr:cell division protein FtsA [Campylobacterota bacterium]
MIIAQSIEKSGLKDQMGAGIVLTGGFTKIEGLRELAVAILDNMPVRLAKPADMGGLFDTLRDPSYSGAVGLIKYSAGGYTPYEIDVNKKMRHTGEEVVPYETPIMEEDMEDLESTSFPSTTASATSKDSVPKSDSKPKTEASKMVDIDSIQNSKNDEPNPISKFWNWATQLF